MTTGVGIHPSSAAAGLAVKNALYAAAVAAFAAAGEDEVDVAYGFRWPARWDDEVAVTAVRAVPDEGAVSPQRRRDLTVQVDVNVVSFTTTDDEHASHTRAFGLLDVLDRHLRDGANITLGGVALWCVLGEVTSDGATAEVDTETGRITEIAATFEARVVVSR